MALLAPKRTKIACQDVRGFAALAHLVQDNAEALWAGPTQVMGLNGVVALPGLDGHPASSRTWRATMLIGRKTWSG